MICNIKFYSFRRFFVQMILLILWFMGSFIIVIFLLKKLWIIYLRLFSKQGVVVGFKLRFFVKVCIFLGIMFYLIIITKNFYMEVEVITFYGVVEVSVQRGFKDVEFVLDFFVVYCFFMLFLLCYSCLFGFLEFQYVKFFLVNVMFVENF